MLISDVVGKASNFHQIKSFCGWKILKIENKIANLQILIDTRKFHVKIINHFVE